MTAPNCALAGRVFSRDELRQQKFSRTDFLKMRRRPITVVLDGVRQNYNIGALFRICDAFLVERLLIAGDPVNLRKRKLVQAAKGTERWVPWEQVEDAVSAVAMAKATGAYVVAVELADRGIAPEQLAPTFPLWLVLGGERAGVSQEIVNMADAVVTIPIFGMANSLNVTTAAAIVLYQLTARLNVG